MKCASGATSRVVSVRIASPPSVVMIIAGKLRRVPAISTWTRWFWAHAPPQPPHGRRHRLLVVKPGEPVRLAQLAACRRAVLADDLLERIHEALRDAVRRHSRLIRFRARMLESGRKVERTHGSRPYAPMTQVVPSAPPSLRTCCQFSSVRSTECPARPLSISTSRSDRGEERSAEVSTRRTGVSDVCPPSRRPGVHHALDCRLVHRQQLAQDELRRPASPNLAASVGRA